MLLVCAPVAMPLNTFVRPAEVLYSNSNDPCQTQTHVKIPACRGDAHHHAIDVFAGNDLTAQPGPDQQHQTSTGPAPVSQQSVSTRQDKGQKIEFKPYATFPRRTSHTPNK